MRRYIGARYCRRNSDEASAIPQEKPQACAGMSVGEDLTSTSYALVVPVVPDSIASILLSSSALSPFSSDRFHPLRAASQPSSSPPRPPPTSTAVETRRRASRRFRQLPLPACVARSSSPPTSRPPVYPSMGIASRSSVVVDEHWVR